jgi:TatD DNase family protein
VLIDTHCHLDFDSFESERVAILERAAENDVKIIVVPAIDLVGCQRVLDLAERFSMVYAAVGIHPNSSASWQEEWLKEIALFAKHEKVVAIGEIGLDYYRKRSLPETQLRCLRAQLDLAADLDLPVILHNREAELDLLATLAESKINGRTLPGVLHSFSSKLDIAERAIELGYFLGFTGPVTFKNAAELRTVFANLPLDSVIAETDAPFLTPHPNRGKRNEPAYVRFVVRKMAEIAGISYEQMCDVTSMNALRLFDLDLPK